MASWSTRARPGSRIARPAFGWSGAYGTDFWVDPQARMSVVIVTNVAGPVAKDLEHAIYAANPEHD